MSPTHSWTHIGTHCHRLEPPDRVYIEVYGDVSAAEVHSFFELLIRLSSDHGRIDVIADIRRMGALSPEARKAAALPENKKALLRWILIVGATFTQRTVSMLLNKAYQLLSRDPNSATLLFVDSIEEAERRIASR